MGAKAVRWLLCLATAIPPVTDDGRSATEPTIRRFVYSPAESFTTTAAHFQLCRWHGPNLESLAFPGTWEVGRSRQTREPHPLCFSAKNISEKDFDKRRGSVVLPSL